MELYLIIMIYFVTFLFLNFKYLNMRHLISKSSFIYFKLKNYLSLFCRVSLINMLYKTWHCPCLLSSFMQHQWPCRGFRTSASQNLQQQLLWPLLSNSASPRLELIPRCQFPDLVERVKTHFPLSLNVSTLHGCVSNTLTHTSLNYKLPAQHREKFLLLPKHFSNLRHSIIIVFLTISYNRH